MKLKLGLLIALFTCALPLHAEEVNFKTIEQALAYCPPTNGLFFSPLMYGPQDGPGMISGHHGSDRFSNDSPDPAPHPAQFADDGLIQNVAFMQSSNGNYGRIFAGIIECFYIYPNAENVPTSVVMSTMP